MPRFREPQIVLFTPDAARAAVILWTDDVLAALAEVEAAGATVLEPPHEWLDRRLIAWAADPDGNPIQLVQRR